MTEREVVNTVGVVSAGCAAEVSSSVLSDSWVAYVLYAKCIDEHGRSFHPHVGMSTPARMLSVVPAIYRVLVVESIWNGVKRK